MPIQDLPVEIMRLILSYSLRRDFVVLQRACWSLYKLTMPLLYEEIHWALSSTNNDNFPLLLRTLLARPQLGIHIKRINILGSLEDTLWIPEAHKFEGRVFKSLAIRGFGLTIGSMNGWYNTQDWLYELREGCPDAFLILVLSYCTNLQSLSLGWGLELMTIPEPWQPAALVSAISDQTTLKVVEYGLNPFRVSCIPWTSVRINSLFCLPELQTLKIQVSEEDSDPDQFEDLHAPSITTLEIHDSYLQEKSVGRLIARTPNLTSLRVDLTRDATPSGHLIDSFLDCSELALSISRLAVAVNTPGVGSTTEFHRNGLENLAISIKFFVTNTGQQGTGGAWEDGRDGNGGWVHSWGIRGSLGGFKAFSYLKTLEIAPVLLFGWHTNGLRPLRDLIPDSLQKLTLRCDLGDWQDYEWDVGQLSIVFFDYLDGGKQRELKDVVLKWMEYDFVDYHDECLALQERCRQAGIRMIAEQVQRFAEETTFITSSRI